MLKSSTAEPEAALSKEAIRWGAYSLIGGIGLWRVCFSSDARLSPLFWLMAVWLVSVPMIVVHELGHYVAARIVGLAVLEFSIGTGSAVWQTSFRGLKIVLRQSPNCGHVTRLFKANESKWTQCAFVIGGPAANLILAFTFIKAGDFNWHRSWHHPSLLDLCSIANLWLGLANLIPFRTRSVAGIVQGSDGWLLWRLLIGKNTSLTPDEIEVAASKEKSGLKQLTYLGYRNKRAIVCAAIFVGLLLSAASIAGLQSKHDLYWSAANPAWWILCMGAALIGAAIWLVRRPAVSFASLREKTGCSPLAVEVKWYAGSIQAEAQKLKSLDLADDFRKRIFSAHTDPLPIGELDEQIDRYPHNLILHLLRFDVLMSSQSYGEAEKAVDRVLQWTELSPRIRHHLESVRMATQLAQDKGENILLRCESFLDEPLEDGMRMLRELTLASIALEIARPAHLAAAEVMLQRAQETYPYDPTIHTNLGALMLARGDVKAARHWLERAAKVTAGTNQTISPQAWLAILAAREGRPGAESLLRKSISQEHPPHIKKRLEHEIRALSAAANSSVASAPPM